MSDCECMKCGKSLDTDSDFFNLCYECLSTRQEIIEDYIDHNDHIIREKYNIVDDVKIPEIDCICSNPGTISIIPFDYFTSKIDENSKWKLFICSKCRSCGGLFILSSKDDEEYDICIKHRNPKFGIYGSNIDEDKTKELESRYS